MLRKIYKQLSNSIIGASSSSKTSITVALDWLPNTNHAGFYVAQAKGWYSDVSLDVNVISTDDAIYLGSYHNFAGVMDDVEYATPCGLVAYGKAHFALNSPEGVINWNTRPVDDYRPKLKAVAAVTQKNTSAIACRPNIKRPRDLDRKKYASYAARFEGRIVQQLIRNDGGEGDYEEVVQPMLGLFNTVLCPPNKEGATDATWIFTAWEGVEAERRGAKLNCFYLEDYNIPYGYAPCLLSSPQILHKLGHTSVKNFMEVTARGFEYASNQNNIDEVATFLKNGDNDGSFPGTGESISHEFLCRSLEILGPTFVDQNTGKWGHMSHERWDTYLDWLDENHLLTTFINSRQPKEGVSATLEQLRSGHAGPRIPRTSIDSTTLFTNEYLS